MLLDAVREDVKETRGSSDSLTLGEDVRLNPRNGGNSWPWIGPYLPSNPLKSVVPSIGLDKKEVHIPSVGILFGTHNWESAKLILSELVRNGLAEPLPEARRTEDGEPVIRVKHEAVERVAIAQLYGMDQSDNLAAPGVLIIMIGMSDDLTQYLVDRTRAATPFLIKYVVSQTLRLDPCLTLKI